MKAVVMLLIGSSFGEKCRPFDIEEAKQGLDDTIEYKTVEKRVSSVIIPGEEADPDDPKSEPVKET